MQLEFLCSLKLPSLVKQRLGVLPPNLQKIYEENYSQKLDSYQEEERRIVENAFRFLLCAQEQLSTGGFLKALSVLDPETPPLSPGLLLDLCFNFIDVDFQLDVFRFAHLSVREYLEAKSSYERTSNHALAAECCVRLLSSDEIVKRGGCVGHIATVETTDPTFWMDTALGLINFHDYACIHWAFHLASSGDFRLIPPLKDTSYAFMMDHQQATSDAYWVNILDSETIEYVGLRDEVPSEMSSNAAADYLIVACVWGFEDILKIRLRTALNPINGQVNHDSGRARVLAAKSWKDTAGRLLLEHSADPKWLSLGTTSLTESVIRRLPPIFQPGFPLLSAYYGRKTPLTWAVKNSDLEMTRMLLRNGAAPTERQLQQAIQTGRSDIAWLLLENGADPSADHNWWGSPVWFAAGKGDLEMLRMLFCWGARAPTEFRESGFKSHPLSLVQECLIADVVQLLQEHGCIFEHELGLEDQEHECTFEDELGPEDQEKGLSSLHLRWMRFRRYPEDMYRYDYEKPRPSRFNSSPVLWWKVGGKAWLR